MKPISRGRHSRPFAISIGVLSLFIFIISAIFFWKGYVYYSSDNFIDRRLNLLKPGESQWLLYLFLLSLGSQFICMLFLFIKLLRDKHITSFYVFCLSWMSLCPLSYCWLLWVYTSSNWTNYVNGEQSLDLASYSTYAVRCILVLLIPVVILTYLIMWSPERHAYYALWQLAEDDIKDWPRVCNKLKDAMTTQHGFLYELMQSLGDYEKFNILKALEVDKIDIVHKSLVIVGINKYLEKEEAYQESYFTAMKLKDEIQYLTAQLRDSKAELLPKLRQMMVQMRNRLLLEVYFTPQEIESVRHQGRLSKWIEGRLLNLNDGLVKAPFWALIFCFSIFLGITYLFGLAFAFHDKAVVQKEGMPDLFMARLYDSKVGEQPLNKDQTIVAGAQRLEALNPNAWPEYKFYFDSYSASPSYRDTFEETRFLSLKGIKGRLGTKDSIELAELNKGWREVENSKQLGRLLRAIEAEDNANHGKGLIIVLRGSADDSMPKEGAKYPSNYALSEARAQNMKYTLLERLARSDDIQHNFEWFCLPQSNEVPLVPLSQEEAKAQEMLGKPSPEERLSQKEKQIEGLALKQEIKTFLLTELHNIESLYKTKKNLLWEEKNSLVNKVDLVTDLAKGGLLREQGRANDLLHTMEEEQSWEEKMQQAKDDLNESIEALQDGHLEPDASKRSVLVALKRIQTRHQFIPLSLMDYMYFTIYTITTTGYGDIIPTTTYAKFLCSLANILEVFFLVVFFNALLSVKGRQEG